ncbi:(2,3-dihydroxybenzoyl)adenylate synthase [Amycolatopsis thermoflava]|uniref:(2,3-dihydroxybenzoyl)adenylate synthase n=1 Tax=Amycolatopsis thermoflava TaxID=84480 RepID=UPI003D74F7FA
MPLDGVVPHPPEFAARWRERGYWRDRALRDVFSELCAEHAEKIALHAGGESITYREVDERAGRLARTLYEYGLRPLDRVVVQMANDAPFVYMYLALQKLGAVPIMALRQHRYREIEQFVRLSGAVACVTPDRAGDTDFREIIARVRETSPGLRLSIVDGEAPEGFVSLADLLAAQPSVTESEVAALRIDPDDPAVFQLSGGTTGIPKLIPRTHNDYEFNSRLAVSVCDVGPDDCLLDVLPIAHNLPLACPGLQGFLMRGARVVLHTSTSADEVFPLIEKHGVTHIHVVPALLIRWLNDPAISRYDLSSVRVIQSGGQRLQPETRLLAEKLLPNCTVQENFGMAEGLLMFVRLDDPTEVRLETVGRPICPDDEVRLVDELGEDVADGEVGELLCRGPYTLRGYFRAPEHNARAFTPDGFYRSGDLMWRHPSGNYVVAGRSKDLINRGGEKISAEEVENLLLGHPAVLNVACVAVPDATLGERMCACIVPKPGVTPPTLDDLVTFLRAQEIASFKLPERLEVLDAFPLSPVGKVSKKDLVARLAGLSGPTT